MKSRMTAIITLLTVLIVVNSPAVHADFGSFLEGLKKQVFEGGGLSEDKIIQGLKEALKIGAGNAVTKVSQLDGYYKNPEIKVPLPSQVQKVEKLLRTVGFGQQVDAFELSMNRAAEQAAPQAKPLFWDAIKQMTFSDARKILDGRENEATLYFREKTRAPLAKIFKPIVHDTMSKVGVTRKYRVLEEKVRSLPFGDSLKVDLDQYVTDKALDGLFLILGQEEQKIREDPAARVTDLLKEVFGKQR